MVKQGGERINLVPSELRSRSRLRKLQGVVSRVSFVFLGIYVLVLLVMVGLTFYFKQQEKNLTTENAKLVADIQGYSAREGLLQVVKNRAQIVGELINKKGDAPYSLLENIVNLLPEGSQVVEAEALQGSVKIVVDVNNSMVARVLLDTVAKTDFTSAELDSLTLTKEGYSIGLVLK